MNIKIMIKQEQKANLPGFIPVTDSLRKAKKYFKHVVTVVCACFCLIACNEDKFLNETPLSFYSPENSYITSEHFQQAANNLYYHVRYFLWADDPDFVFALHYATDFMYNATNYTESSFGKLNDYTNVMVPSFSISLTGWKRLYYIIKDANIIISRLDHEECQVPETEKIQFKAEALFFRGFAYRTLAHVWGGVPLVLTETDAPRLDLTRATREDVYWQCEEDLDFAANNLPDISSTGDGKVSKQVAQHLLAEIYISLGELDKAIQTATACIESPSVGLMTARFGSRVGEPGDVYWDLFRLDNQNRKSGNKEGLYVVQYEYQNPGSNQVSNLNWAFVPYYSSLTLDGQAIFAGVTDVKGGRGIGWGRPTNFFFYEVWGDDFGNDIRNSTYNIVRDMQVDNESSPHFGKWIVADGIKPLLGEDTVRYWFPIMTKLARVGNFPTDLYQTNADGSPKKTAFGETLLLSSAQRTYKDEYLFRLAETYLLRAEAYLGQGDKGKAANDINAIRDRAGATRCQAADVTIDYILDERLRELYAEELRMVTLCRLGKLVERNRKYNIYTGKTISDHHNLWPIPYSEIQSNIYGDIEQNPGYTN